MVQWHMATELQKPSSKVVIVVLRRFNFRLPELSTRSLSFSSLDSGSHELRAWQQTSLGHKTNK
eukprot:2265509-Amphidinium_carterae.1